MTATQISTATDFVIATIGGARTVVATYPEALEYVASIGGLAVGHSGDLEDGGDRTLVWASEADAKNDDGAKAIATIRARY
jgi:hypothetical protein